MRRKLFVSQPMRGKTKEAIKEERKIAVSAAEKFLGEKLDVIDSILKDHVPHEPIKALGKSIILMGDADVVCFADGWKMARGCQVEKEVAESYGLLSIEVTGDGSCVFCVDAKRQLPHG